MLFALKLAKPLSFLAVSFLLRTLGSDPVRAQNTTMAAVEMDLRSPNSSSDPSGPNLAAIVAPTVTLGVLAITAVVLVVFFCVVRKKRQTEGTYRPSSEEQTGARSVEAPGTLKLPKEERLI